MTTLRMARDGSHAVFAVQWDGANSTLDMLQVSGYRAAAFRCAGHRVLRIADGDGNSTSGEGNTITLSVGDWMIDSEFTGMDIMSDEEFTETYEYV